MSWSVYLSHDTQRGVFYSFTDPSQRGLPLDAKLEPWMGLIAVMRPGSSTQVTFTGPPYELSSVPLTRNGDGVNLIGLPVRDPRLTRFSDIMALGQGKVVHVVGQHPSGKLHGYLPIDISLTGGQAIFVIVSDDVILPLVGEPWSKELKP